MRCMSTQAAARIALTPVQQTSLLMAYWRMLETNRSSMQHAPSPSLIQDHLAQVLVDKLASPDLLEKYRKSPFLPIGLNFLAIRTRVIDDWLVDSSTDGPRQVVNLGAGMCTRPYRLQYLSDSTIMYEVDDLELLNAKQQVLQDAGYEPRVQVQHVAGDVTDMDTLCKSLLNNGFDPSLPTDWIAEGLFAYLDPKHHMHVFCHAKEYSCSGSSRFISSLVDPFCREYGNMLGVDLPWAELRPIPDVIKELKDAGWSKNVTVLGDEEFMRMFKRTVTLPIYLVSAETDDCSSDTTKDGLT